VSPGCKHCYAEGIAKRFFPNQYVHVAERGFIPVKAYKGEPLAGRVRQFTDVMTHDDRLLEPLSWRKPQRVFVNSMSDLFHEDVPFEFVDKVWDVMWNTPRHTYQVLTKRPERMLEYIRTRAYRRQFAWTDKGRCAMKPGDYHTLTDIRMRNMCGYVGVGEWACDHPTHGGKDDTCDQHECPIASLANSRAQLREIGDESSHEFEDDDFADECEWMQIEARPKHAAAGNVWLGFSAEDQKHFEARARVFRSLRWELGPRFVLFCSMEPLLGPIDCSIPYWPAGEACEPGIWNVLSAHDFGDGGGPCLVPYLNWVIVGGESGPGARPFDLAWARSIVQQCKAAGVACFVKQLGSVPVMNEAEWRSLPLTPILNVSNRRHAPEGSGLVPLLTGNRKGGEPREWPEDLRVREFPEVRA
jgi:protein gp37